MVFCRGVRVRHSGCQGPRAQAKLFFPPLHFPRKCFSPLAKRLVLSCKVRSGAFRGLLGAALDGSGDAPSWGAQRGCGHPQVPCGDAGTGCPAGMRAPWGTLRGCGYPREQGAGMPLLPSASGSAHGLPVRHVSNQFHPSEGHLSPGAVRGSYTGSRGPPGRVRWVISLLKGWGRS